MDDIYDRRKKAPLWWYNKSSDLRASAGAIWFSMEKEQGEKVVENLNLGRGFSMEVAGFHVYKMLCGMSVELMLKAVIVAKGESIKETHNLIELSHIAGISYDNEGEWFIKLLTEDIIWAGRYPVPKKKEKMDKYNQLSCEYAHDASRIGSFKFYKYNNLYCWENFNQLWTVAAEAFRFEYNKNYT